MVDSSLAYKSFCNALITSVASNPYLTNLTIEVLIVLYSFSLEIGELSDSEDIKLSSLELLLVSSLEISLCL